MVLGVGFDLKKCDIDLLERLAKKLKILEILIEKRSPRSKILIFFEWYGERDKKSDQKVWPDIFKKCTSTKNRNLENG